MTLEEGAESLLCDSYELMEEDSFSGASASPTVR